MTIVWRAAGILLVIGVAIALRAGLSQMNEITTQDTDHEVQLQSLNVETPPDWRLERAGGGHLTMGELRGGVAMLYFWTTW